MTTIEELLEDYEEAVRDLYVSCEPDYAAARHAIIAAFREQVALLKEARKALLSLPEDALGIGGDGTTHWFIRDELVDKIDVLLHELGGNDEHN